MKNTQKNIAIWSIFDLCVAITVLVYLSSKGTEQHISDCFATSPAHSLYRAQKAINLDKIDLAEKEIFNAISDLKSVEAYSDLDVNVYLERAVEDLTKIESELLADDLNVEDLNIAFFETMNALAYADLKIAEKDLANGDKYKAIGLLKASVQILQSSLLYMDDSLRNQENMIISQLSEAIDSLTDSPYVSAYDFRKINAEIEEILDKYHLE